MSSLFIKIGIFIYYACWWCAPTLTTLIHAQTFKGTVSREEYFLMACNNKSVHSVYALVVFKFFLFVLLRKSNGKFLLASLKTLTLYFENPSNNPLQSAYCGIRKPACYYKTCSGTQLWFWKLFRISKQQTTMICWNCFSKHQQTSPATDLILVI